MKLKQIYSTLFVSLCYSAAAWALDGEFVIGDTNEVVFTGSFYLNGDADITGIADMSTLKPKNIMERFQNALDNKIPLYMRRSGPGYENSWDETYVLDVKEIVLFETKTYVEVKYDLKPTVFIAIGDQPTLYIARKITDRVARVTSEAVLQSGKLEDCVPAFMNAQLNQTPVYVDAKYQPERSNRTKVFIKKVRPLNTVAKVPYFDIIYNTTA